MIWPAQVMILLLATTMETEIPGSLLPSLDTFELGKARRALCHCTNPPPGSDWTSVWGYGDGNPKWGTNGPQNLRSVVLNFTKSTMLLDSNCIYSFNGGSIRFGEALSTWQRTSFQQPSHPLHNASQACNPPVTLALWPTLFTDAGPLPSSFSSQA